MGLSSSRTATSTLPTPSITLIAGAGGDRLRRGGVDVHLDRLGRLDVARLVGGAVLDHVSAVVGVIGRRGHRRLLSRPPSTRRRRGGTRSPPRRRSPQPRLPAGQWLGALTSTGELCQAESCSGRRRPRCGGVDDPGKPRRRRIGFTRGVTAFTSNRCSPSGSPLKEAEAKPPAPLPRNTLIVFGSV